MIGKLDPDVLARVLARTGAPNDAVQTGATYGEDAAAIDLGDAILVVSSDPISLASESAGTLAVPIAANDVAASGADPEFLTNVLFLPSDDPALLETLTTQLDEAATAIGATIVGGHTEYLPELSRPTLSITCFGRTDRFIPTGGAAPGDTIILTKGAAIEGTAILASDFESTLLDRGVEPEIIERAQTFVDEISVLPESRLLRSVATAMHDPTEGGVRAGLCEMAAASAVDLHISREQIRIRGETKQICDAMAVDPLSIFGSGALLAAVPSESADAALASLQTNGIDATSIGTARSPTDDETGAVVLDRTRITDPGKDELYPLWE